MTIASGIHPVLEMEHVARVTSQQCSCQRNGLLASTCQDTERIALSGAAPFHLMDFVTNEEVEIPVQVTLHVVSNGESAESAIVRLPQCRAAYAAAMLPMLQCCGIHLHSISIYNSRAAIRAYRNPATEIESGPPRIGQLCPLLAHHVVAQALLWFMWINGQHIGQTRDDARLRARHGFSHLSHPLTGKMAGAHDQDSRWMTVFHDIGHGSSDERLAHTHLADTHHVIVLAQRLDSPLDCIGLSLKGLSLELMHACVPCVAGFEKRLGFGLYLFSQSPAELMQISVHVIN